MHPIMTTKPTADFHRVKENARRLRADDWYLNALSSFYIAGLRTGVDPVILAAQSAQETGWGRFGGEVHSDQGNTAGFRNLDNSGNGYHNFHMELGLFPHEGALAQAYHIAAYAGVYFPEAYGVNPRYIYVEPGTARFGIVDFVEELGGVVDGVLRWARDDEYGNKIAALYEKLVS